ncbi:hypothetical protein M501DRAFT_929871 [Patellaria atrata CBS 101060]|uniref:Uncharacterized protein n=1 Tax=Patellaria atrata CBS 101060 TaxID=1346257 RepID=A0A9P4VPZ9_9PEZI|nr:hypothetical protein M501DRAFT_929871 [Patellaria atrata CBS 101060]
MVEVDNLKQRVKHRIAKAIVSAMDKTIRTGRKMSSPVREAFNKASDAADVVGGFVKSHPVFCTVIAFGVLALLLPWVLEAIGFAELGPIEGSWAARWQSTYNGVVPKDSLFSFFQRLGMVWHHRSPFGSEIHGVMDSIWDSWMKLLTEQSSSSRSV